MLKWSSGPVEKERDRGIEWADAESGTMNDERGTMNDERGRSPVSGLLSPVSVIAALLLVAGWASAQPAGPGSKYYVWGQVRTPGAYSFVASPDILELLSAGGGPTENANLKRVVLIRAVTKKRTRINLQAMLDKGEVVRLSPGDVVIVPSSAWYYIRDGLTVLTSAASLVSVILLLMNRAGV